MNQLFLFKITVQLRRKAYKEIINLWKSLGPYDLNKEIQEEKTLLRQQQNFIDYLKQKQNNSSKKASAEKHEHIQHLSYEGKTKVNR